jgi:uncharacterized repeat protein (TIGR01451 family)
MGTKWFRLPAIAALTVFLIMALSVVALAAETQTITSDKADYAPGETVTLSGSGWTGDTIVHIHVDDTLGKTWSHDVDVPVDEFGNVSDVFTLSTRFVSQYDATATGNDTGRIATTTFTDAAQTDYEHWLDEAPGSWAHTTLQQTNSAYFEGEAVPHYYELKGLSPNTNYSFRIIFDYKWNTKNICGFSGLASYDIDRTPDLVDGVSVTADSTPAISGTAGSGNFYTDNADVTAISGLQGTGIQRFVDVSFTTSSTIGGQNDKVRFYWGLKLSLPNSDGSGCAGARAWPGASLQTNVGNGPTGDPVGGGGTLQISPKAVQANADVQVAKSDSPDPVTQGDDLTYTITAQNAGPGTATDVEVIDTLPANTTYVSATPSSGFSNVTCTQSSGVVTCKGSTSDPLTLIPGSPLTITLVVTVTNSAPTAGTISTGECQQNADRTSATNGVDLCNIVTVSTTSTDSSPANNTDTEPTNVVPFVPDTGSLKISKVFDPKTSGFTGKFSIGYDCDDGTAHDGTVSLGAGENTTIGGIPTGTQCTVSESSTPTPPSGWSFGTPTYSPATGTVTIATNGSTYEVTVTNSISRDTGSLKISKTVDAGGSNFTSGSFTVHVSCTLSGSTTLTYDRTITYPNPGNVTITGIPTGYSCVVTETNKPAAPAGYVWGTPVITGSPATITKGGTAEVSVKNSLLIKSGALTMGFCQNVNGQTIIKNYRGTNCQDLANWLKGIPAGSPFYGKAGPFKDLTASTCGSSPSLKKGDQASGVVGYVYNVVKNATCASKDQTSNTMLKAQMLATALDVYFSDPSLGGNRIGAYNGNGNAQRPIGGLKVDLSTICKMIDGSGGTATCSGTKYTLAQVQGVLGVPSSTTSLTVSQILGAVAGFCASSDGLTAWYGQDKTKQVIAKDIFDSINNQVVLILP